MTAYQPESRRPIAGVFRKTARASVRFCVSRGIHPDAISYLSIVAAAGAGLLYWRSGGTPWLLVPAAILTYLRLWLNMLDGMVAVEAGLAGRRGELVNDLPDRVSDVLIFAGAAHSGWCHPATGYWAAILALMTAYVGISGQAVGVGRRYEGIMSKPWRMVLLHIGAWITLGLVLSGEGGAAFATPGASIAGSGVGGAAAPRALPGGLTVLDLTHLLIVAGCLLTIRTRLASILRRLRETDSR